MNLHPYHATYFGKSSQEEFKDIIEKVTRKKIIEEVKEAKIYSIVADTTPDVSHEDHLVVYLRYVNMEGERKNFRNNEYYKKDRQ